MITSNSNPKIKRLAQLQKKRKAREEEKVYLVEGLRMFAEAPREMVQELYVSESFYKKRRGEYDLDSWGNVMEILSDSVFSHVSDTQTPQGVLLVMKRRECTREQLLGEGAPFLMVLDTLQDPGNLGTIIRAGEAAGVTGVLMSSDTVDVFNPKVIRSTMGSIFRMPFAYTDDLVGDIAWLHANGVHTYAAHLDGKTSYEQQDFKMGCAFLIGNEGNGLRKEVADAADIYVKIPMLGEVESLNAAIASTVLMFEAARQRRNA